MLRENNLENRVELHAQILSHLTTSVIFHSSVNMQVLKFNRPLC